VARRQVKSKPSYWSLHTVRVHRRWLGQNLHERWNDLFRREQARALDLGRKRDDYRAKVGELRRRYHCGWCGLAGHQERTCESKRRGERVA